MLYYSQDELTNTERAADRRTRSEKNLDNLEAPHGL